MTKTWLTTEQTSETNLDLVTVLRGNEERFGALEILVANVTKVLLMSDEKTLEYTITQQALLRDQIHAQLQSLGCDVTSPLNPLVGKTVGRVNSPFELIVAPTLDRNREDTDDSSFDFLLDMTVDSVLSVDPVLSVGPLLEQQLEAKVEVEARQAQLELDDIEARHRELLEVEQAINDTRSLFFELAVIVEQQTPLVQSIEGAVCTAGGQVRKGRGQLRKAEARKNCWRKRKLCLVAAMAVAGIVAVAKKAIAV